MTIVAKQPLKPFGCQHRLQRGNVPSSRQSGQRTTVTIGASWRRRVAYEILDRECDTGRGCSCDDISEVPDPRSLPVVVMKYKMSDGHEKRRKLMAFILSQILVFTIWMSAADSDPRCQNFWSNGSALPVAVAQSTSTNLPDNPLPPCWLTGWVLAPHGYLILILFCCHGTRTPYSSLAF
jgi:hypothetical protein